MNGIVAISLLACVSASTNFRVQMLIDVFESLVYQTHEQFEELEILTIESGPEKKLLSEAGFSSSATSGIKSLEALREFIEETRAAADEPVHLASLAGIGDPFIISLVTTAARIPIDTEILRKQLVSIVRLYTDWNIWAVELQEAVGRLTCEEMNVRICDWQSDRPALTTKLDSICKWFIVPLDELRTRGGVEKERITRAEELLNDFMKSLPALSKGHDISKFIEGGTKAIDDANVLMDYFKEITDDLPNSRSHGDPKLVPIRRVMDLYMRAMKYTLGEFDRILKAAQHY